MKYYQKINEFVENKNVFLGIDVHLKTYDICVVCDGEVVEKTKIRADYTLLKNILHQYKNCRHIKIAYEAGFCGFWLYRNLVKDKYDCMVTPPGLTPRVSDRVKTDKRDAQKLAFSLSAGFLKAVWVPPQTVESDRQVIRCRAKLVKKQTRTKNQIRSFLNLHNLKKPEYIKNNWTKAYIHWLEQIEFGHESDHFHFSKLVQEYKRLATDLVETNLFLRKMAKSEEYNRKYKILTSLRGVGLITAMCFILEIYDFGRFSSTDKFGAYLGLTPSQFSSGPHIWMGHITRQGNAHLRRVLVESAWTVIRHDPHLRAKYDRIRAKGENGKKAIVAVARSLAIRLRAAILQDTEYVIGVC